MTKVQCDGRGQWFSFPSREFTYRLPHCSNFLCLDQPTMKSPLSETIDVQFDGQTDPGLYRHLQTPYSTRAPPDSDNGAASDIPDSHANDNPHLDMDVSVATSCSRMSTAPSRKGITLSSPKCLFRTYLLDILQQHWTRLELSMTTCLTSPTCISEEVS